MRALFTRSLLIGASAIASAGSWSGYLVDSACYDREERNVSPHDTLTSVDRDKDYEVRVCHPRVDSKSFAIVDRDGIGFHLDSEGNRKAGELLRQIGKPIRAMKYFSVDVTGEMKRNALAVSSITAKR